MPRYRYNLRDASAKAPTPLNFVVRWSNRRLVYPTRETIAPEHWNRTTQRAKSSKAFPEHPEFNERLGDLHLKAQAAFRSFLTDNGREPEVEELRSELDRAMGRKTTAVPRDLLGFVSWYNAQAVVGVNRHTKKPPSRALLLRNRVTLRYLEEYVDKEHRGRRIAVAGLNSAFVEGFTGFLTTHKRLANNTVNRFVRTLRLFLNEAELNGLEMDRTFRATPIRPPQEEQTGQVYLNEAELNELYQLDLSTVPRLERVRDLFVAGAWIGLRFGDLAGVRPEHMDGNTIRVYTSKTGTRVTIPLHPVVRAILRKYDGQLPPAISNQRMNDFLKEVCRMVPTLTAKVPIGRTVAGVHREVMVPKCEVVTTHTMRRSFASNLYRKGVPARTVMAITGHKTEGAFTKYIRLDSEEHAAMIAALPLYAPMMQVVNK